MPLTDSKIKAFRPAGSVWRVSDGDGLYLEVTPRGTKTWRMRYRFGGAQVWHTLGAYSDLKLGDARFRREEIRRKLRAGKDPKPTPTVDEAAPSARAVLPTWRDMCEGYLEKRRADGAAGGTVWKLEYQIGLTVSALGDRPVAEITARDVIDIVAPIAQMGRIEKAHEIRTRFSQVFRYAIAQGVVSADPAALTHDAILKRRRGSYAGVTDPDAVGRLMRAIRNDCGGEPQIRAAMLLSAYLFPRNSELRGMRWSEIDWSRAVWEISGARMKMGRDHIVPLPRQALDVLREIRPWTGRSELVIPAPRDSTRMVSDNTFNRVLRRIGYPRGVHVHHGFRTTASTNLNENGWNSDWIERQLAHVQDNKVRASYNKALYLEGRTEMMQWYADWLDRQAGS